MQPIPANRKSRLNDIVAITDRFCEEHLDAEFQRLCRSMGVVLCLQGVPLERGTAASWAAGIIYSLTWVNLEPHHLTADGLGVSPARFVKRARVIRRTLDLRRMDPRWSTRRTVEQNPRTWLVLLNGVSCDIRTAAREVQEEAYRRGIIPFLPEGALVGR